MVAFKFTLTNYLNFNKPQFNTQRDYPTFSSTTGALTSPKLSVGGALTPSSNINSTNLTEVCYHLSRTMGSIASVSADARPLYVPKTYDPIFNDVRTLLPEAVEGYSLATTN